MLMRRDAFMVALSVPEELEFDAHESEPTTRHVLGLIGDGPVAYARWRLATVDGNNVALCDRLCVREAYRGRGVARAAMQHILIDILQVVKHSMISLAGLAFATGMVMDAAIIVLENIIRRREGGEDAHTASERGAGEVWGALLASTTTTVAIFLPIFLFLECVIDIRTNIFFVTCSLMGFWNPFM